ncbi:hypothetical protein GCM10007859_00690 [Brevundimonas denitrificans]|uniref:Uncharacterized protein n=1 Tax=Brevundimonas denitrificans TaxID=1443434 RepID=A0ABQ6BDM3_9CAUL|nr:hypothetical protein GCM10007859_00690 [Brevundimonas denitrificans]
MVTSEVTPALTSTAVAPSAAGDMVIEPVPSMEKSWLESTVTAVPETREMPPPLEIRIWSAVPVPVAFDVVIGVVRTVVSTTSAMAPVAAIRGAIATAVASRIRIR